MSKDEHNDDDKRRLSNEISKDDGTNCVKENLEFIVRHHAALMEVTDNSLHDLLQADTYLSDLPYGCTHEEVLAQIGAVKGQMITVLIKRDGLSTLKIVVPQSTATVAQLKKNIKSTIMLEQNRSAKVKKQQNYFTNVDHIHHVQVHVHDIPKIPLPHMSTSEAPAVCSKNSSTHTKSFPSFSDIVTATRSSSSTKKKKRRKFISWRLIWNTYILCTVDTNRALIDGRALLSDFGIGNKTVLKFVKRERIFGRQRRRSLMKRRKKVKSDRRNHPGNRNES